ncbi:MAG: universal stress protein, partial [Thermodesulfobacteriota bacterium]
KAMTAKIKKILYATDFSEGSEVAAQCARAMADLMQAEVLVLHVLSEFADPNRLRLHSDDYAELEDKVEKLALEQMHEACERHFNRENTSWEMRVGIPFKVIIETARENDVDMIIMGTHGRTGIAHVVLGSTAERVMRKAGRPVLTVPWRDKAE